MNVEEVESWKARAEKAEYEVERLRGVLRKRTEEADRADERADKAEAERDTAREVNKGYANLIGILQAERDEARAQVAMAFEVAAAMLETLGHVCESGKTLAYEVRGLTPADAEAALEAYGRKKMWEGMHLAATIAGQKSTVLPHYPDITRGYAQGRSGACEAILAEMDKLK